VSGDLPFGPEALSPAHDAGAFECGREELNGYLTKRAFADQQAEKSRTYVVCRGARVVAYLSLAAGSVERAEAPECLAKGQGQQSIPVILLARLAVDVSEQGRGLGEALLVEALRRSAAAADIIGARAVIVHAKDQEARSFYERYGFEGSPTNPLHLVLLMKDVRKSLGF
jgi:predicted N-acetyltransferase YhbS